MFCNANSMFNSALTASVNDFDGNFLISIWKSALTASKNFDSFNFYAKPNFCIHIIVGVKI